MSSSNIRDEIPLLPVSDDQSRESTENGDDQAQSMYHGSEPDNEIDPSSRENIAIENNTPGSDPSGNHSPDNIPRNGHTQGSNTHGKPSSTNIPRNGHTQDSFGVRATANWDWSFSPYTRHLHAGATSATTPLPYSSRGVANSVFSVLFERPTTPQQRLSRESRNRVGVLTPSDVETTESTDIRTNGTLGYTTLSSPPIGHHGDFHGVAPRKPRGFFSIWANEEGGDGFNEDKFKIFDDNTIFGTVFSTLGFQPSDTLQNEENRQQARNGLNIADNLTSTPLSKTWHYFSEVFMNLVFLMNIAVAITDIVLGPTSLHYKITALVLGLLENIVTFIMWAIRRSKKFKESPNREKYEKYQQYIENIVSEALIYPLLVLSILGFTTEKMYQSQSTFGYVQLALIIFDTIVLVYSQILRLYMLYRLIKDLKVVLAQNTGIKQSSWKIAGSILPRCYYAVIGNFFIILGLACLFGMQTNYDNSEEATYQISAASGMSMICLILLPNLSLVLFVGVNLFWIIEMLIQINYTVGTDKDFNDKLRDTYGNSVADALQYTTKRVPSSAKRLEFLQDTPTSKKLLYCLYEVPILVMLFVWEWLLIVAVYLFDGFENDTTNMWIKIGFAVLLVIASPHVTFLMFMSNFYVIALMLGFLVYPFCVPFCCKRHSEGSKYKHLLSKELDDKNDNVFDDLAHNLIDQVDIKEKNNGIDHTTENGESKNEKTQL